MEDEEYGERIARVERWAQDQVDLLSTAPKKSRPGNGESNILHDVVASMSIREKNAKKIAMVEAAMQYLSWCVEADCYEQDRPLIEGDQETREYILGQVAVWDLKWKAGG